MPAPDPVAPSAPAGGISTPAVIVFVMGAVFLIFWGVTLDTLADVARVWLKEQAAQ